MRSTTSHTSASLNIEPKPAPKVNNAIAENNRKAQTVEYKKLDEELARLFDDLLAAEDPALQGATGVAPAAPVRDRRDADNRELSKRNSDLRWRFVADLVGSFVSNRPIAVVQVWNLLSLLTCPKPPMFFGSFKILRSFCSRPSLGLQQSAWHSAATDLKWHKRIDFGADVPFGWLGAQLFSIPRCTLCTRSHCQQYPQRSHTAERHQQDCGP